MRDCKSKLPGLQAIYIYIIFTRQLCRICIQRTLYNIHTDNLAPPNVINRALWSKPQAQCLMVPTVIENYHFFLSTFWNNLSSVPALFTYYKAIWIFGFRSGPHQSCNLSELEGVDDFFYKTTLVFIKLGWMRQCHRYMNWLLNWNQESRALWRGWRPKVVSKVRRSDGRLGIPTNLRSDRPWWNSDWCPPTRS